MWADKPVPDVNRQASSRCGQTSQFQMWTDKPVPDVKSKAIPLQAWTGPEGSRRLRLPDFKRIGT